MININKLFYSANIWLETLQEKQAKRAALLNEAAAQTEIIEMNLSLPMHEETIFEKQDLVVGTDHAKHLRDIHMELHHIPVRSLAF